MCVGVWVCGCVRVCVCVCVCVCKRERDNAITGLSSDVLYKYTCIQKKLLE